MQETYETPSVTELGSIEELTQATHVGTKLDGSYGQGTPINSGILS